MAQQSILWPTSGVGDGASSGYSEAQLTAWLRRTFQGAGDLTKDAVLRGYLNGLAVSGGTSPVSIATGAALVYGIPYENTAAVALPVPTPTAGPTGHTVVLRADWAAQTVRIALVSSGDGFNVSPILTQNAGVRWEVQLANLSITTDGVISIVDKRGYVTPPVGDRAPTVVGRKGGSSTDWAVEGTTVYVPNGVALQCGAKAITIPIGAEDTYAIIPFPSAFANPPLVVVSVIGSYGDQKQNVIWAPVAGNEKTQFAAFVTRDDPADTAATEVVTVSWMALGPM